MAHDIPDRCLKTSETSGQPPVMSQSAPRSGASKARLVITAIALENRTVAEVVADYAVSRSWVYELLARYRAEGDAAFDHDHGDQRPHPTPPQPRSWSWSCRYGRT